jgi:hypothetical protein
MQRLLGPRTSEATAARCFDKGDVKSLRLIPLYDVGVKHIGIDWTSLCMDLMPALKRKVPNAALVPKRRRADEMDPAQVPLGPPEE